MRFALILLATLGTSALAQPKVGDLASEIQLEATIGHSGPATLGELRGRAVVLEMWATWCSPCIPALDHLAEVAAEVEDLPVTFIAVTDEPEETVRQFLAKRPTALPIGVDSDSSVFDAYRPGARPQTLLIAPDGTLAARTVPDDVTADVLRNLIAGEPLGELEAAPVNLRRESAERLVDAMAYDRLTRDELDRLDQGTVYKAIMRPYEGPGAGGIFIYNRANRPFAYRRVTSRALPTALVFWATDGFGLQHEDTAGLPQVPWFADVIVPEGEPTMREVKAETLRLVEKTFGAKVSREVRPTDVLRLVRIEDAPLGVTEAEERGTISMQGSNVEASGRPFREFVLYLQSHVDRPILDETGLDTGIFALYDFEMEFVLGVEGEMDRALANLGFALIPEDNRPMDTILIEPAE